MKTMNDPAKDAYFEPACYASRIAALISEHQSKDERPDWWQQVVAQLHSQLDKQFPQFEVEFEELTATDVIPPWKGGSAHDELPDFFRLPEMAPTRMNLLEWRQNGFEQRIGDLEARLPIASGNDSGELAKIADLLDYVAGMVAAQGNDPDSGNATDLEMNLCAASKKLAHLAGVIPPFKGRPDRECPVCGEPEDKPHAPDCEYAVLDSLHLPGMENSRLNAMDWRFNGIEERLGTVESNASAFRLTAMQETIDRLTARIDELGDLLIKALLQIDALEQKAPR